MTEFNKEALLQQAEEYMDKMYKCYYEGKNEESTKFARLAKDIFQQHELWEQYIKVYNCIADNQLFNHQAPATLTIIQTLLSEAKHYLGEFHTQTAKVYEKLSFYHTYKNDFNEALKYLHKALDIYEVVNASIKDRAEIHGHLGNTYGRKGDLQKAIYYNQKALLFAPLEPNFLGMTYGSLGAWYKDKRDFSLSLLYYQKAIPIIRKALGERHSILALTYSNFSLVYKAQGDLANTLVYAQKAVDICEDALKKTFPHYSKFYLNLGWAFLNNKKPTKALYAIQKAHQNNLEQFGTKHPSTAESHHMLGRYHASQSNDKQALEHCEQALEIRLATVGRKHFSTAEVYITLGDLFLNIQRYDKAAQYYHQILISSFKNFNDEDIYTVPTLQNYYFGNQPLVGLKNKGLSFYKHYLQQKDKKLLSASITHYQAAMQLIDKMRQGFQVESSQLLLSKNISTLYFEAISVVLTKGGSIGKELAFDFNEKSKAYLLLSSMQDSFAKAAANIPSKLLQQEHEIKVELAYLEKNIQKELSKKEHKESTLLQKWKSQFFDIHQSYLQLIQQFETDYPNYYQLKYQTQTASIEDVQNTLKNNQVLLNYFVAEKHFYIFVLSPTNFEAFEFSKIASFEALIKDFLFALNNHDHAVFADKSHQLYQLLIQPIEDFIIDPFGGEDELKHLLIVPHEELSYLPFEALISTPASTEVEYLIHHCEISYHYSATLWHYLTHQNRGERAKTDHSFVGFAPVYQSDSESQQTILNTASESVRSWATRSEAIQIDGSWTPLPHSKIEAENIAVLFEEKGLSSQIFLHENATKEQFQEAAEKSRFLLVAAHGLVNDEHPKLSGLVFYPPLPQEKQEVGGEKREDTTKRKRGNSSKLLQQSNSKSDCILSMEEAYHLKLQAELVVLSSCESGIGTLAKGEGMMAVNRGFLYAGAKNVISTLFKVYDKQSSLLTQYLFEEILKETSYVAALRKAKLRLMEQEGIDTKSWCGFVLIGRGN